MVSDAKLTCSNVCWLFGSVDFLFSGCVSLKARSNTRFLPRFKNISSYLARFTANYTKHPSKKTHATIARILVVIYGLMGLHWKSPLRQYAPGTITTTTTRQQQHRRRRCILSKKQRQRFRMAAYDKRPNVDPGPVTRTRRWRQCLRTHRTHAEHKNTEGPLLSFIRHVSQICLHEARNHKLLRRRDDDDAMHFVARSRRCCCAWWCCCVRAMVFCVDLVFGAVRTLG